VLCYGGSVANSGTIVDKGKTAGCCWLLTQENVGNAAGGRKIGRWDRLVSRSSALCTGKPTVFSYARTTVGGIIQERLYVNGKLDYTVAAQAPPSNGASNFCIGGTSAGDFFFDGAIGEVQVHGSALSYDQIRANHVALLNQCNRSFYLDPPSVSTGLKIGWIGDSITDPTFVVTAGVNSLLASLSSVIVATRLGCTVTNVINSSAGTKTAEWLPDIIAGSGNFETADKAFDAAGVQLVVIELGINDAVVSNSSAGAFAGNLARIAREFVDRGKVVVIMPPTYASSDATNQKTREYVAVTQGLANGVNTFAGDSQIWVQSFEQNANLQLFQDGVHLLTGGQQFFAGFYADAIVDAVRTLGWFP
ncbi:MAG: GDSL-type esterase/lipase family protein, partial [Armatimonadota bacterium]